MIRQLQTTAVSRQQTRAGSGRGYSDRVPVDSCEAEMTPVSLLHWHATHAMHGCSQEEGSRAAFDGYKPLISHQG